MTVNNGDFVTLNTTHNAELWKVVNVSRYTVDLIAASELHIPNIAAQTLDWSAIVKVIPQ